MSTMADPVGFYELDGTVFWRGPGTLCKGWDEQAKEWRRADPRDRNRLLSPSGDAARMDATEVARRGIPVDVPDTWRDRPKGEGGIGQAFLVTIPVGLLASLIVGVIVLVVFILTGRSWMAAIGGPSPGASAGPCSAW